MFLCSEEINLDLWGRTDSSLPGRQRALQQNKMFSIRTSSNQLNNSFVCKVLLRQGLRRSGEGTDGSGTAEHKNKCSWKAVKADIQTIHADE